MIKIGLYFLLWWLLVAVAIFATQNLQSVSISFLAWQSINLPVGLILVFCAGLGALTVTFLQVLSQVFNSAKSIKSAPSSSQSAKRTNNFSNSNKNIPNKSASKSVPKSTTRNRNQETRVQDAPRSNSQSDYKAESKSTKENDWEARTNDWDNW